MKLRSDASRNSTSDAPRSADREPEVTVIVPAWNVQDDLGHCLRALEAQTLSPKAFEIIVVDNGSTDGTVAVADSFAGVRVLSEPRPGSYHARNTGLAHALGDYIAFTDADCRPAPDWLSEAVSACRIRPGVGLIGGRIELFSDVDNPGPAELYERIFAFRQKETVASGRCTTANWISPRAVLDQLGGFDGALKSGGDYELSLRIGAAGYPLAYVETMVVRHPA
ncbi:MAG: Dolichyl-phosphate mannose synthase related protein, partial [Brevundimonas sp.]|nr:Dolichyl-phosphate mannose synthase related protein [Brevundimonas sp.]